MAQRYILALNKIDHFSEWLKSRGWTIEPTKGCFEVLRARHPSRKRPIIVYKRMDAKVHASILEDDFPIVIEYLRWKKCQNTDKQKPAT